MLLTYYISCLTLMFFVLYSCYPLGIFLYVLRHCSQLTNAYVPFIRLTSILDPKGEPNHSRIL